MSPLTLRRYRAERLLRNDFERLRGEVIATVRGRLRASGVRLDASDLQACYAQAWQGLYTAMVGGETIANPSGWLVIVTFRRALDEHRTRRRDHAGAEAPGGDVENSGSAASRAHTRARARVRDAAERDIAEELDDRRRLRQLFEGLRGRLTTRECQAAALCYLQGLSRAEAAERMGIGEARMRKLMEGSGGSRPGVAGKVGELLDTISGGGWCEEQSSTMRGLAFGILDSRGERYRLALAHQRECPACRRYVLCLRGLAAALPPIALPWRLLGAGGAAAGVGAGAPAVGAGAGAGVGTGAGAGTGTGVGAGAGAGGVGTGAGVATGGLSAAGAAGVGGMAGGAAGGGWLLAGGSVGAKLAVGCLLALSVGCVALTAGPVTLQRRPAHTAHRRGEVVLATGARASSVYDATTLPGPMTADALAGRSPQSSLLNASTSSVEHPATPAARAAREFGPEQTLAARAMTASAPLSLPQASVARQASSVAQASSPGQPVASAGSSQSSAGSASRGTSSSGGPSSSGGASGGTSTSSSGGSSGGGSAAAREFGIG
jgi:DNA-directed RNA polymerase specialized sigma24 family protein